MFFYLACLIVLSAFSATGYQYLVLKEFPKPKWIYRLHYASLFAGSYVIIMLTNAAAFLTIATISMLLVKAYDHTQPSSREASLVTETSRDIWLFLLVFWFVRTFIIDYSPIPSGSMEPTLVAGDVIAINKLAYQIKVPPFSSPLYRFSKPKRGDAVVFNSPLNPNDFWIKRVIAVSGDEVEYRNKQFFVNGKLYKQFDHDVQGKMVTARENIDGYEHSIQLDNMQFNRPVKMTVPNGTVFVSGDNRDYSLDSRMIGAIPEDNIVGKAVFLIFQFKLPTLISFSRSGNID